MDNFNERMYKEAFPRGGYAKYVGDFVTYANWENGRFVSYANIVSNREVEIEFLDVRTGYYDVLGSLRSLDYLTKQEIWDGMERMVASNLHLYT